MSGPTSLTSTCPMGDGIAIPFVGVGTFQQDDKAAKASVLAGIANGYRHIDTANVYGNEAGVGEGLAECGIARSEIFVTSKLWPGYEAWGHPEKDYTATIEAFEKGLEQIFPVNSADKYLDLYLIHAPFSKAHRLDQWKAIVELKKQGKIKSIGVSNYGIAHIQEIIDAGLPLPACNQLELHPLCQKPELLKFMKEKGVAPIAYSSLAPMSNWRKNESYNGKDAELNNELYVSPFIAIAEKYNISEARLLLKWALQRGFPILPKSNSEKRIVENSDLFSFTIDDEDMTLINSLDANKHCAFNNGLDPSTVE